MPLTDECGHHCGIIMTGKAQHEAHCSCNECHGRSPSHEITIVEEDISPNGVVHNIQN